MSNVLRFEVLGPVRCNAAGTRLRLGHPRQQAVLCMLLSQAGRPMKAADLVDAVWGDEPPSTGRQVIATYVYRLRKLLGSGLDTEGGGYTIRPDSLDAAEFVSAASAGRRLLERGDPQGARRGLDAGLELWRGEPFAGLPGPGLETERGRLGERWLEVREESVRVDLALGRSGQVVADLRVMIAERPFHERYRALLMAALHGAGRQAEALAEYARFFKMLADELGTRPGSELSAMHQAVLVDDRRLVARASGFTDRAIVVGRRDDLPAAPALHGRDRELFTLGPVRSAPTFVAIDGPPGVGKTALALTLARRHTDVDGRFYLDLCGRRTRPKPAEAALREALLATGLTDADIPEGRDERAARWRAFLTERRVVLVVDDVLDVDQVLPLLPGDGAGSVIITSTRKLIRLPATRTLSLMPLDDIAARRVLLDALGTRGLTSAEVDGLVEACEGLPLSLVLCGRMLRHRLRMRPSALTAPGGLELLEPGVLAAITSSVRRLDPASTAVLRQVVATGHVPDVVPAALADSNLLESFELVPRHWDAVAHSSQW
jgi:DNA-binding SARP family transcriptional activator